MNSIHSFQSRATLIGFILLGIIILGSVSLHAQTKQILQWKADIDYLQNASSDELVNQRAAVEQIRTGIEFWVKMHPGSKIELKEAPAKPWGADELRNQVSQLHQAVDTILTEESGRPFELGITTVSVTAESSPLSPIVDGFSREEIINRQAVNAAAVLDYLPGVAIDHASSGRNEASIRIRGLSTKGQVPLYIDGIPVSMPYDGTIDFNRFLSSGMAEVQVAKGFSSPLLGPNGMGGSINLVTREPEKKLQGDALLGTGSGDTFIAALNLGSRWEKFYIQGSVDWNQFNFIPLSGNFPLNDFQPTYERIQSDTRDSQYTGRFGYTPKGEDQYVFSYTNQKGEKGVPLYAGPNANASFGPFSFRRWPYWNKTGYYLITNTGLGEANSLKLRAYYDEFKNELDFYDDNTYSTMNKTTSNLSKYDDHSTGASAEFTSRYVPDNTMSASFLFRDDNHKETLIYPSPQKNLTTPTTLVRSQTFSMGYQDIVALAPRLRLTFGFSADYLKGLQAQRLNRAETGIIPVTCPSDPQNTSYSGCTSHVWTYNPQASLSYTVTSKDNVYFTFADRSRFPLLKESYSYGLGRGIPNPDLKPEHNTAFNVGYSHSFGVKTVGQIEYFYNRLRDAIQLVYVVDEEHLCTNTGAQSGYCSQNVNVAKQVNQGFEFSLRSTLHSRLTLDLNYSYINRNMVYNFGDVANVSQVLTSIQILPTYPKNKVIANFVLRLPREILAMANYRYEGGITLQDTTYRTPPGNLAFSTSYGTVDIGTVIPIIAGLSAQAGIKNLFDRDYYYTPGFPEIGRNWFFNMRYRF
jgi:iron complex outermembrane recepter protein